MIHILGALGLCELGLKKALVPAVVSSWGNDMIAMMAVALNYVP